MRTLEKLLELDGKIYIRLDNSETSKRFLRNAEREGFLMSNGERPTESKIWNFYRLCHDKTIEPFGHGFAGSMVRHSIINGLQPDCISVDYSKYISGEKSYIDGK